MGKRLLVVVVALAVLAAVPVLAMEPVKIGMITTLSTKAGYLGEEIRDGFQLAIDQEGGDYIAAMEKRSMHPIFIYSPTTGEKRMRYLAGFGRGFVYCVARKGVTGMDTRFSDELGVYLARCRAATDLPLALGFGVKEKADVDFLRGKVDIAVIGTQTIRLVETQGVSAVGAFIRGLR